MVSGMRKSGAEFRFLYDRDGRDFLLLETGRWRGTLQFIKRNKISAVAVSQANGFRARSLDVLREIPSLEALYLQEGWGDYGPVYAHPDLRWLLCGAGAASLDLARFPALETLRATWWPRLEGIGNLKRLNYLNLDRFRP